MANTARYDSAELDTLQMLVHQCVQGVEADTEGLTAPIAYLSNEEYMGGTSLQAFRDCMNQIDASKNEAIKLLHKIAKYTSQMVGKITDADSIQTRTSTDAAEQLAKTVAGMKAASQARA